VLNLGKRVHPKTKAETPSYILARRIDIESDAALDRSVKGARGARKLAVTRLWPDREEYIQNCCWSPTRVGQPAKVLEGEGFELAYFTERAKQDRHYHRQGTEIYTLIEGLMDIEIEGDRVRLQPGDSIIVRAGAVHEIENGGERFLAQVVTINCGGESDKFVCDDVGSSPGLTESRQ